MKLKMCVYIHIHIYIHILIEIKVQLRSNYVKLTIPVKLHPKAHIIKLFFSFFSLLLSRDK